MQICRSCNRSQPEINRFCTHCGRRLDGSGGEDSGSRPDAETPEQAERILSAQATREARLAAADDIVDNSGSLAMLAQSVQEIYASYLSHTGSAEN